jgi:hypothetical protein
MTTSSQKLAKSLEDLLNELTPEALEGLTEEELIEYRKLLNPYGRTIQGADKHLTFSFTNLSEKYIQKLNMTGMIGFLNQMCDEWKIPDAGIPTVAVSDYLKDPSLITSFSKNWTITDKMARDIETNKQQMAKRVIVKEFLNDMFQYNPNVHVKSVYKPNIKDTARGVIDTPAANLAISQLKKKDAKFREQMLEFDRVQKLVAMKEGKGEVVDESIANLVAKKLVLPEYHYMTRNYEGAAVEDINLIRTVNNMIPPADIFHRYQIYYETNYDKLREAVLHLYSDKPDFDIAINPYDWHDSEEDAATFQKKHSSEVITDILKADSGKWNFFAPFAKVRESMKYFNEKTLILEEIASQIEEDAKIGEELMKNRIRIQKQKNIDEDGPDDEYFKKWRAENNSLKDMGALTINEESYADEECPDDGIQVDIFSTKDGVFEKDRMYTKAVAPTALPEA